MRPQDSLIGYKIQHTVRIIAPTDVNGLISSFTSINKYYIYQASYTFGRLDPLIELICIVCRDECKKGEFWYTLCNCGNKFHVHCIGHWIRKDSAGNGCTLCRISVPGVASSINQVNWN